MKMKLILTVFLSAVLLSSCMVTTPFMVTNNPVGKKEGRSSTISFFSGQAAATSHYAPAAARQMYHGLILNQDFGIAEAAKNGKISKIATVDFKVSSFVFFTKQEFIVTGE